MAACSSETWRLFSANCKPPLAMTFLSSSWRAFSAPLNSGSSSPRPAEAALEMADCKIGILRPLVASVKALFAEALHSSARALRPGSSSDTSRSAASPSRTAARSSSVKRLCRASAIAARAAAFRWSDAKVLLGPSSSTSSKPAAVPDAIATFQTLISREPEPSTLCNFLRASIFRSSAFKVSLASWRPRLVMPTASPCAIAAMSSSI
mmetsp:Transcript_38567/g.81975  ORF Transcript_38567/g.81975 Transcript_38567/m.81975 type:complete len:208 (+) Transcript_38567:764-1387(+)